MARELSTRCNCNKDHLHISLLERRAKNVEQYPRGLFEAVCRGVIAQKDYDRQGNCCSKPLNCIDLRNILKEAGKPAHWTHDIHQDTEKKRALAREVPMLPIRHGDGWACDDVAGAALPPDLVIEARCLEVEHIRSMGVYTKLHKSAAKGKKIIGLRTD